MMNETDRQNHSERAPIDQQKKRDHVKNGDKVEEMLHSNIHKKDSDRTHIIISKDTEKPFSKAQSPHGKKLWTS